MPGRRGKKYVAPPGPHGGDRTPAHPAPVSGVGAGAKRTDGGPGQPIAEIPSGGPGATFGDRQALEQQQQGAPLAAGNETPAPAAAPAAAPAGGGGGPAYEPVNPFGPTRRPGEPLTAGAMLGPGSTPNPQQNLRDLLGSWYAQTGYPDLLDVIEELDNNLGH